jgi:hypothetical protein
MYRTSTTQEADLDLENYSVADQKIYQITKTKETSKGQGPRQCGGQKISLFFCQKISLLKLPHSAWTFGTKKRPNRMTRKLFKPWYIASNK